MLLITPFEVIANAFTLREKIGEESIRPLKIDIAQEHFIRPRFGDLFFEKMCSGEYAPFVDSFIKPALAHFVRYGVIDELSVQMSDDGAVIYGSSGEVVQKNATEDETEKIEQTIVDQGSGSSVVVGSDKQITNDETVDNATAEEYVDTMQANYQKTDSGSNLMSSVNSTKNITSNSTTTDSSSNSRDNQSSTTNNRNGNSSENRTAKSLRVATNAERRVIAARALSDANILLAKAVRYVEKNVEQFALYLPSTASSRIFF